MKHKTIKFLTTITVCLLLLLSVEAKVNAESELDSLESLLPFANDLQRVDILNGIALQIKRVDTAKAGNYARQALNLSVKLNYCKGNASAKVILGILAKDRGDYLSAKMQYLEGLALGLKCKDPFSVALAYNCLGGLAHIKGDYPLAIKYYMGSYKLSVLTEDKKQMAKVLNNIGVIFMEMSDNVRAEEYLLKALSIFETFDDELAVARISNNLADIYQLQQYPLKALHYYSQALEVFRRSGSIYDISSVLNNLGAIYVDRGQHSKAFPFIYESFKLDLGYNNYKSSVLGAFNLSNYYLKQNNLDSAIYYAQYSYKISKEKGFTKDHIEACKMLSEIFLKRNEGTKSQIYQNEKARLEENYFDPTKTTQVNESNIAFQNLLKEQQVKVLEKESEIKKLKIHEQQLELERKNILLITSVATIFFLGLILLLVLYILNIDKKVKRFELSSNVKNSIIEKIEKEIKKPLNAIVGFTSLASESRNLTELRDFLSNIKVSTDELLYTLSNIVGFIYVDAKRQKLSNVQFDFVDSVSELLKLYEFQCRAGGIKFLPIIHSNVPKILHSDKDKINSIIANLMDNAVKFTDEGEIKIDISASDLIPHGNTNSCFITISIYDEGCGISDKRLKTLFKNYRPEESSEGFGIGLKIVKSYIDLFDGELQILSKEKKGTTVITRLKVEVVDESLEDAEINELENGLRQTKSLSIIVAEENVMNQNLLKYILEADGHSCQLVKNSDQLFQRIKERTFDLIILDVNLPGVGGLEAARIIKKSDEFLVDKDSPIIAISTLTNLDEEGQIAELGISEYKMIPLNKSRLLHMIRNITSKHNSSTVVA